MHTSLHGYADALYDALPDGQPGLTARHVGEIVALRGLRKPRVATIRRHLRRMVREGVVAVDIRTEEANRFWRIQDEAGLRHQEVPQ